VNSAAFLHCALKSEQWSSPLFTFKCTVEKWSSPLHIKSSIELLSVTCVFNAGIVGTHKAELSFQPLPNMMFTRLALKAETTA